MAKRAVDIPVEDMAVGTIAEVFVNCPCDI
jgi:hypothetical protein